MTRDRLEMAGYAAIAAGVLAGVSVALQLLLRTKVGGAFAVPASFVSITQLLLAAYLIFTWKRMLTDLFGFGRINALLDMSLMLAVCIVIAGIARTFLPQGSAQTIPTVLLVVGAVLGGVIQIGIGKGLMALGDDLGGLLKPYCFIRIAIGVCCVSIVFALLAPLGTLAASVLAALIFFNTASRIDADGQLRTP